MAAGEQHSREVIDEEPAFMRSISTPILVPHLATEDQRDSKDPLHDEINKLSQSRFDEKGSEVAALRKSRKPGSIVHNQHKSRQFNKEEAG